MVENNNGKNIEVQRGDVLDVRIQYSGELETVMKIAIMAAAEAKTIDIRLLGGVVIVSDDSPVGKEMLKTHEGEFKFETPDGLAVAEVLAKIGVVDENHNVSFFDPKEKKER